MLSRDDSGDKLRRSYSVGGFSPYFLATSVWAWDASHNEYKWAISISDLARLMALLNISIALSRFPLKGQVAGYSGHFGGDLADRHLLILPLNLDGSHRFIGKVTFIVDLNGLIDEV